MQCECAILYCHLLPAQLYNIFPHYLINGTIFEKKNSLGRKIYVLIFSTKLYKVFLILRRIERDIVMNVFQSSPKTSFILARF